MTTAGAANPPAQSVTIVNTEAGSAALNWTASSNQPWLSVSPGAGTAPGSASVSVSLAGLTAGTHNGTVTISSSTASNSPTTIPVTLTVRASYPPRIDLSYGSR